MADVGDGILVVGTDGQVFTSNPAAQRMLALAGEGADFRLGEIAALAPIAAGLQRLAGAGRRTAPPATGAAPSSPSSRTRTAAASSGRCCAACGPTWPRT